MQDLIGKEQDSFPYFTKQQIGWMSTKDPPYDWFLGKDLSFVRVHGFTKEPFCLPTCVTDRTLALEIFRQLVVVENVTGSSKHDTAITQGHKIIGPILLERKVLVEGVLMSKLVQLGFVVINDSWNYDHDDCLAKRKNAIAHVLHESWEV